MNMSQCRSIRSVLTLPWEIERFSLDETYQATGTTSRRFPHIETLLCPVDIAVDITKFFCFRSTDRSLVELARGTQHPFPSRPWSAQKSSAMKMCDLFRLSFVISILCLGNLSAVSLPSAPPNSLAAKSVMRKAAEQLGIPEVRMTVFADSLCVQGHLQPQILLTPFVTYRTGEVPDKEMVIEIYRSKYAVFFKCSEFEDDRYYKYFGCRLLFTLHANSEQNTRSRIVNGTTVYVMPEGFIKTEIYVESDLDIKYSKYFRTRSGVNLPPQDSKCLKLTDVSLAPIRNSPAANRGAHGSEHKRRKSDEKKKIILVFDVGGGLKNVSSSERVQSRITVTNWLRRDSVLSIGSDSVKCIIPVQAHTPQPSEFLKVFSVEAWLLTVISITLVCFVVTSFHLREASKLLLSLGISALTTFVVELPFRRKRHSNSRFMMLVVVYFLLQVVLLNIYKNEITAAFSQVESSAEIRTMMRYEEEIKPQGADGDKFLTRPFYARSVESVRLYLYQRLRNRKPYCDVNVNSLLIYFSIPHATYSEMPVFCNIGKIGSEPPSPYSETLRTLQKFGLVNLKTPYHLKGTDKAAAEERKMHRVNQRAIQTWELQRNILREVYDAVLESKEQTVLDVHKVVPLLQALSAIWFLSCFCWLLERSFRRRTVGQRRPKFRPFSHSLQH